MDISYIHLHFKFHANPTKSFRSRGFFKKNEISINTICPGEEQINKQVKYHPYVLDISYISCIPSFMQIHQTVADLEGFKAISIIN